MFSVDLLRHNIVILNIIFTLHIILLLGVDKEVKITYSPAEKGVYSDEVTGSRAALVSSTTATIDRM